MSLTMTDTAVLKFLRAYIATHGIAPTYAEISEACALKTKSRVKVRLDNLQAAGLLTFQPRKLRSIQLAEHADAR